MDTWRAGRAFATVTTASIDSKGPAMFEELTEELLDLSASVRGYGAAVYAVEEDPGSSNSCSLCCSIVLCCCCALCW
jgi:hypothetical protein